MGFHKHLLSRAKKTPKGSGFTSLILYCEGLAAQGLAKQIFTSGAGFEPTTFLYLQR
jgi:hypothetical protein